MHYLDYNEKKQHGTDNFPMEYYAVDEHHPRYHMPFHWHKETELLRVQSGHIRLFLNDEEYMVYPGDLVYITDGIIHGAEPFNCTYECLVFDPATLLMHTPAIRQYMREIEQKQITILPYFDSSFPELKELSEKLFSVLRIHTPGWEFSALGHLFTFYGMVFEKNYYHIADNSCINPSRIQQLKPVLEYIDAHYHAPISLTDLSRLAGMSPKYFCHLFYTVFHRTPIDYLNYYRIERACYLLETESVSVTEIAYRCGFNDSSYFVRCFKKYKNTTPKQYSKIIKRTAAKADESS